MNLHDLADGLEAGGQTLYQLQLQGGVDGQSLVGLVDSLSYEKRDVGGLLEQHFSQKGGSVLFGEHLGGEIVGRDVFLSKFQQAAQGNHALGRQVYAVDVTDGRDILVGKVEAGGDLLAQILLSPSMNLPT